jgi:YD repeat-containing protein
MVAIVTGNGAGVLNSSANTLGQQGVFGDSTLGKTKEAAYVNVSNGNLVVQDKADLLASRGLNFALTRTYNSQGNFDDGIGDDWKLGLVKQVTGLTGTANTSGSTVVRIDSDGSSSLFVYDEGQGCYVSNDGAGAYQRLTLNDQGKWIWTSDRQDETGNFETYDSNLNEGRIQTAGQNGETLLTYGYDTNNRLASVTDASGDVTQFFYDSAGRLMMEALPPIGPESFVPRTV